MSLFGRQHNLNMRKVLEEFTSTSIEGVKERAPCKRKRGCVGIRLTSSKNVSSHFRDQNRARRRSFLKLARGTTAKKSSYVEKAAITQEDSRAQKKFGPQNLLLLTEVAKAQNRKT